MKDGEPSRTAFGAARHRALHQVLEGGRIFSDPLAWRILGEERTGNPDDLTVLAQDRRGLRLFIAARHRIAEDTVANAVARGARQVVVLGAGLDTFAYRNPHPGVTVYEVDFPATGAWKRERLAEAGLDAGAARFVGVDFERDDLRARLIESGFDPSQPSAVMWLGVVPYLTPETVAATLRVLGGFTDTVVIFDYPLPEAPGPDGTARPERAELRRRVAELGEPLLSTFTPQEIEAVLRDAGFTSFNDRALRPDAAGHVMVSSNYRE